MTILRIAVLTMLAQIASPQAPSPASFASVHGMIRRADSGGSLASATVELRRLDGSPPQSYSTTTGADGVFLLSNVRPGDYRLIATRAGFLRSEYGQRRLGGAGVDLNLVAGQAVDDIQISMMPPGAIYGRIVDPNGDPIGDADVRALTSSFQDGQRVLKVVQSAITNDLGEYRLFGLIPGQYFLNVTLPVSLSSYGAFSVNGGEFNNVRIFLPSGALVPAGTTYVPIYYPGTPDVRSATPLDLALGANLGGVDFTVAPLKTHHVRGRVPGGRANVTLASLDSILGPTPYTRDQSAITGPFDFDTVAPGQYLLVARSGDLTGSVRIDVGDADLDNVTVALGTGFIIPTHVTFDDRVPLENDPDFENVYLRLTPDPQIAVIRGDSYNPFPDGHLGFEVMAGEGYRVTLERTPASLRNAYIKSIRMGTRDVLGDGLQYNGEADARIEIVIGTKPGSLIGNVVAVVNEKQRPSINTTVVLAPEIALRRRADAYKTATTDNSGRFQMDQLRPGDYTVFAWDDVESGVWQDPDFLKLYEARGTRIHIGEGSKESVTVTVIPAQ